MRLTKTSRENSEMEDRIQGWKITHEEKQEIKAIKKDKCERWVTQN